MAGYFIIRLEKFFFWFKFEDFKEDEATLRSYIYTTIQQFTCSSFTDVQPVTSSPYHNQVEWWRGVTENEYAGETER